MRSAESSCSVLTGLAKYSDAPASRHFSRSPFIAFAVSAMIGKRRSADFWRITCIVSYPSISGIIISISTIAMSGVDSSVDRFTAGPSSKNRHASPLQHAAEREDIAHVVIHHQHLLSHQSVIRTMQLLQHPLLFRRKVRHHAMQEQRRLIQQSFRRLDSLDYYAARQGVQTRVFVRRELLPGKHHDRQVAERRRVAELLQHIKA